MLKCCSLHIFWASSPAWCIDAVGYFAQFFLTFYHILMYKSHFVILLNFWTSKPILRLKCCYSVHFWTFKHGWILKNIICSLYVFRTFTKTVCSFSIVVLIQMRNNLNQVVNQQYWANRKKEAISWKQSNAVIICFAKSKHTHCRANNEIFISSLLYEFTILKLRTISA